MEVRANFTLERLLIWQRENPGKDNGVAIFAYLKHSFSLHNGYYRAYGWNAFVDSFLLDLCF